MHLNDLINDLIDFWNDRWENKALIIVGVVVLIILVYAFNPFQAKANITENNDSAVVAPTTSVPVTQPDTSTLNSSNSTNTSGNSTFMISADQAKQIALQGNIGYTAGDPLQGTIVVNQTTVVVWIVPLSKGSQIKNVYVDVNTGKIIDI
ncbi:PepSY domain-containing protein [Methanobacterium ferruginis]|uniref:PepSY domain-containing protein n=1 Tax=Methanobacterium ferruginis TaxID=710191 RepID=UPI0025728480|nr:PepSY domain-containing protein [Methanobacterium ferruginis]BDZ68437.1 hypothetical protein GCM10025860_18850 [Methanobacterium ferruginis]